jgi:hypothetical protein
MPVDPVGPVGSGPLPETRPAGECQSWSGAPTDDRWADQADAITLSSAARALAEAPQPDDTADVPPQGTISAERLREVLDRLNAGFYDRPEVQDRIARRLSKDLGSQPTE